MKEARKVKTRRSRKREIPLVGSKTAETRITYRRETVSAAPEEASPVTAESLSLAFERDARRYPGLWEVEP